jgi:tRNA-2-methylthio-N6-dimethylallyladenosine synthase
MEKIPSYHIVTYGCAMNVADSERIASSFKSRGWIPSSAKTADVMVINTCMIRESAENRIYGLVHNLALEKKAGRKLKIILTGCIVGMALRDKKGTVMRRLRRIMPDVDEFLPIEEVGFDFTPLRTDVNHAWVPITNGCNNFCTYCVVPYTRGREISRPLEDILAECRELADEGYSSLTLLGQNVNSYGSDLAQKKMTDIKPVYVKHLGRMRIPTLFPQLLSEVAGIEGLDEISFLSSNPWDFSDELIRVIAENKTVSRQLHLPVQSGDNEILIKMNRWYTREEYFDLVGRIKNQIPEVRLTTDIIVGFCGETESQFANTVDLVKRVGFCKAYISMYSDRSLTAAHRFFRDSVPFSEKKSRYRILDRLVNYNKSI